MQHALGARVRLRGTSRQANGARTPLLAARPPGGARRAVPAAAPPPCAAPARAPAATPPAGPAGPSYERVECERVRTAASVMQQLRQAQKQEQRPRGGGAAPADGAPAAAALHLLPCPPPPPAWRRLADAVRARGLEGVKAELLPERVVLPEEGRGGGLGRGGAGTGGLAEPDECRWAGLAAAPPWALPPRPPLTPAASHACPPPWAGCYLARHGWVHALRDPELAEYLAAVFRAATDPEGWRAAGLWGGGGGAAGGAGAAAARAPAGAALHGDASTSSSSSSESSGSDGSSSSSSSSSSSRDSSSDSSSGGDSNSGSDSDDVTAATHSAVTTARASHSSIGSASLGSGGWGEAAGYSSSGKGNSDSSGAGGDTFGGGGGGSGGGGGGAFSPPSLSRHDLFHGHLFVSRACGGVGVLMHAVEYPQVGRAGSSGCRACAPAAGGLSPGLARGPTTACARPTPRGPAAHSPRLVSHPSRPPV
jgi:hypothetical protein